ncbi:hypothetical protein GGQ65_001886 [Rhizobium fabae]|uniref:Uncharacterized protein n=1 Tax=Rhizobium fabae TaxID=573179 RepID=A0A7W6B6D7_9HYPH|nr:hypothetical protein [Rhizobium fabae]
MNQLIPKGDSAFTPLLHVHVRALDNARACAVRTVSMVAGLSAA